MTLFEELKTGLMSGIQAFEDGVELKTTVVSSPEDETTDDMETMMSAE